MVYHVQHPCLRLHPSRYRADSGLAPLRNVRRQAHQKTDLPEAQVLPGGRFLLCYSCGQEAFSLFSSSETSIPSSSSCFASTGVGASVIRQEASFTFGKAITSRMLSQPPISITTRSRPYARPACGGTPYLNASSRKPNCSCACLRSKAQYLEHLGLDVALVDTDRTTADLGTV